MSLYPRNRGQIFRRRVHAQQCNRQLGGQGQGLGTEMALGWSVDLLERPRKAAPEEVLKSWAREWAKEGVAVDWQKFMPQPGFQVLPRRWSGRFLGSTRIGG
jgi:hypothetical protein